ncbi:MAG: DNA gyrase C-terminal beta-propeller domain-containing protein, partial [Christensenellaceae bacterium]
NSLYKHTNLQVSDGIIMLALVESGTEPKLLNLKDALVEYLEHQKTVITRRTRYELAKAEERAHILEGLVLALANIDEVIRIIKESTDKVDANNKLTASFALTERQANAILEMRLQRLTSLEVEKLRDELTQLEAQIADYKDILANEARVLSIIKTDLETIREKYPSERRTEVSMDFGEIEDVDLIDEEDVVISMTHSGYVKRLPVSEYKAQRRGGMGVTAHRPKDEDFVEKMFVCSTHDDILLFSNLGKVYAIKAYEIPEAQRAARGRAMVNIVQIGQDEKIAAMIPMTENETGYIAMATKLGLIKKTDISEFARIQKGGKIAIRIVEDDELISVQFTTGSNELLVASREGKCIRFAESDVRPMGRDTQGVKAMELGEGDMLVDMLVLDPDKELLTITSNGYGKRSDIEDYRLQGRAGKGIKAGEFNAKTGYLVNMKLVGEDDDVMIISENGTIIRMHVSDISKIGRNTVGVRVMNVKDSRVATASITEREETDESEDPETEDSETDDESVSSESETVTDEDGEE